MKNVWGMVGCSLIFMILTFATIWLSVNVSLWFCCGYCMLFILGVYAAILYDMNKSKEKK